MHRLFLYLLALFSVAVHAGQAEHEKAQPVVFSHWWVSPGERASIAVLQKYLDQQGIAWQERASPGSGTARYGDVLRAQLARGEAPTASQMIGHDIHAWARSGLLENLDDIAREQEWDEIIPVGIQYLSKYQGHWFAAPINAHSTNWLWVNARLLRQIGGTAPDTWHDLLVLLQHAQQAGIPPLAIGNEPWEHTLLFESVAVGAGGAEFYRKAFIELDPTAFDTLLLERIFERMSQLRPYLAPGFSQRNWTQSTDLLRQGQALMQVQGSWVGGEFNHEGVQPGREYHCFRFPDTQGVFLFNSDQYVFFKDGPGSKESRKALASTLMNPDFQRDLNLATGAAPARVDVDRSAFNACGKSAIDDLRSANMRRALLGSIAMGNANVPEVKAALYQVISQHLRGEIDSASAATRVRQVVSDYRAVHPAIIP